MNPDNDEDNSNQQCLASAADGSSLQYNIFSDWNYIHWHLVGPIVISTKWITSLTELLSSFTPNIILATCQTPVLQSTSNKFQECSLVHSNSLQVWIIRFPVPTSVLHHCPLNTAQQHTADCSQQKPRRWPNTPAPVQWVENCCCVTVCVDSLIEVIVFSTTHSSVGSCSVLIHAQSSRDLPTMVSVILFPLVNRVTVKRQHVEDTDRQAWIGET